jgi:hypothetical protein
VEQLQLRQQQLETLTGTVSRQMEHVQAGQKMPNIETLSSKTC